MLLHRISYCWWKGKPLAICTSLILIMIKKIITITLIWLSVKVRDRSCYPGLRGWASTVKKCIHWKNTHLQVQHPLFYTSNHDIFPFLFSLTFTVFSDSVYIHSPHSRNVFLSKFEYKSGGGGAGQTRPFSHSTVRVVSIKSWQIQPSTF